MAWKLIPTCDGPKCGAVKGEGNNWLEAAFVEEPDGALTMKVWWADAHAPHLELETFCGTACLLRRLSEQLGAGRRYEQTAEAA
jgi:hypothetical protein